MIVTLSKTSQFSSVTTLITPSGNVTVLSVITFVTPSENVAVWERDNACYAVKKRHGLGA